MEKSNFLLFMPVTSTYGHSRTDTFVQKIQKLKIAIIYLPNNKFQLILCWEKFEAL